MVSEKRLFAALLCTRNLPTPEISLSPTTHLHSLLSNPILAGDKSHSSSFGILLTGERESSKDGSVMDPSAGTILVIWCVDPVAEALTAALGVWTGRWRVVVRPAITRAPCARKISIFLEIFLKKECELAEISTRKKGVPC